MDSLQVFDVGKGTNTPITGLEFHRKPQSDVYYIFVATPSRLYYFSGKTNPEEKPLLHQVFNCYLNVPEENTYIPGEHNNLPYSRLSFWSENLITPDSFAWMTEFQIVYGKVYLNFYYMFLVCLSIFI